MMKSFSTKLPNILIPLVTLPLLTAVIFAFAYAQQKRKTEDFISSHLTTTHLTLARAIAGKDWIKVAQIGNGFRHHSVHAFGVRVGDRIVFSQPSEDAMTTCEPTYSKGIELYGIEVGRLDVCIRKQDTVNAVLKSPSFLLVTFLTLLVSMLIMILPLFQYKRSLLKVVHILQDKLASPSIDLEPLKAHSDLVTQGLIDLMNRFTEQQLRNQRKIDELDKMNQLNKLAAQVAHDIRSPLSALKMVVSTMKGDPPYKEILLKAAERIDGIANHLLADVRERSSAHSNEPIHKLLRELVDEKRLEFQNSKKVEIDLKEFEDNNAIAKLNAQSFKQVMSNLINNAVEACDNNGKVSISFTTQGHHAEIIVKDNGKGMPPELLEKVGTWGFTFGKANGTGIGFYSVKELLSSVDASIKLDSKEGLGTTVRIQMPIDRAFGQLNHSSLH